VLLDELGGPADRVGHGRWVAHNGSGECLAERPGEHDRLVLQGGVEQPDPGKSQLQYPSAVRP